MEQELEAYLTTLQAGVRRHEAEVAAMQASFDEVGRVRQLMTRLPDKVRHKAMVPYGKHAFFEGELIHTNEFLLGLGCGYKLEASARDAEAVLERRQARVEPALRQALRQLEEMRRRVAEFTMTVPNEEGDQFMEIRQDYEESEALLQSAKTAPAVAPAAAEVVVAPGVSGESSNKAEIGHQNVCRKVGRRAQENVTEAAAAGAVAEAAGELEGQGGRSGSGGGEDDADRRIFERLEELERLEAAAGSSGSDQEAEDEVDLQAGGTGPGAAASAPAAVEGPQPGGSSARRGGGGRSAESAQAASPQAAAAVKADGGVRQQNKAGTPLRKGFLLGGGGGGSTAGRGAKQSKASGAAADGAPSSSGATASGSGTGAAGNTQLAESSGPGGVGAVDDVASCTSPAGRRRRVSFTDGSQPGQADDASDSQNLCVSPASAPAQRQHSSAASVVRPALKAGGSRAGWEEHQAVGAAEGAAGAGGARAGARSAALEDGGDAAMAMARAREEAFTGLVRERAVEDVDGSAGIDGSTGADAGAVVGLLGASGAQREESAPPKRVSKFKQQRMGSA